MDEERPPNLAQYSLLFTLSPTPTGLQEEDIRPSLQTATTEAEVDGEEFYTPPTLPTPSASRRNFYNLFGQCLPRLSNHIDRWVDKLTGENTKNENQDTLPRYT
jgi:hypothetical protein